MISVNELKRWLAGLADDDFVGMDDGGLTLQTEDGKAFIEIGGLPEEEEVSPVCAECRQPINTPQAQAKAIRAKDGAIFHGRCWNSK